MAYDYNKKSLWKWILLYVIIGVVAYGLIYYFFFYQKGGYGLKSYENTTQQQNQAQNQTQNQDNINVDVQGNTPSQTDVNVSGSSTQSTGAACTTDSECPSGEKCYACSGTGGPAGAQIQKHCYTQEQIQKYPCS